MADKIGTAFRLLVKGGTTYIPINNQVYRQVDSDEEYNSFSGEKTQLGSKKYIKIGDVDPETKKFTKSNGAREEDLSNSQAITTEAIKSIKEESSPSQAPFTNPVTPINYRGPNSKIPYKIIKTYPIGMESTDQDRIEFSVWEYANKVLTSQISSISAFGSTKKGREDGFTRVQGAGFVFLPITRISDTNSVDWQEDRLNEIQRNFANVSLGAMVQGGGKAAVEESTSKFDFQDFIKSNAAGNLMRLYFAGQAVQVNGLLTRATGATLNPNLELLFNGPQLRQFSFVFDMIARKNDEANIIKDIIYFFKAYMAVRDNIGEAGSIDKTEADGSSVGVFLNSPYVFRIRYLKGKNSDSLNEHKSIGKIKMCALQSCNVDYTPMGTYMTFDDESATMVMYRINLQFKELTPIYASDYEGDHQIGY